MDLHEIQQRLRARTRRPGRAGHRRLDAESELAAVAIGADHGGVALKRRLVAHLHELGHPVTDVGTHDEAPVDYPDIAVAVAQAVTSGRCRFGVVIDAAGIGSCMAANKVAGIRAAACLDEHAARNSREHNDANVLVLGARFLSAGHARRVLRVWLATPHAGGRHARRVAKIDALDVARS